jgi:hypothetical protein
MWAMLRNTKGMLKTLTSGTTGPTGPSEVRRIWIAPTWVCSIISFSLAQHAAGEHLELDAALGGGLQLLAHALHRRHGGVTGGVGVGGLEHGPGRGFMSTNTRRFRGLPLAVS